MSVPLLAGSVTAVATLLGWTLVKDGIRAGVKLYNGPFSTVPKLIMWGLDTYSKWTSMSPKKLVVLLAKRMEGRLFVRSAYVVVSSAVKGMRWGIVKIAKGATYIGSCLFASLTGGSSKQPANNEDRYTRVIADIGVSTKPHVFGRGLRDVTIDENYYAPEAPAGRPEVGLELPPGIPDAIQIGQEEMEADSLSEDERFLVVTMDDSRDDAEQVREFEQAIGGNRWNMYTVTPEEAQIQASFQGSSLSRFVDEHSSFVSTDNNDCTPSGPVPAQYTNERTWANGEVSSHVYLD